MDYNPEEFSNKEVKELSIKNGEGFEIVFEKSEGFEDVRVWQKLYGETVFLMSLDRHALGDMIYALEDLLE
jgi:hypothetical protein